MYETGWEQTSTWANAQVMHTFVVAESMSLQENEPNAHAYWMVSV
jgi:hypothetical protein